MACNPNYDLYPSTAGAEVGDSEASKTGHQDRAGGGKGRSAFTELFALGAFELLKQFPGSSFSKYLLSAF